MVHHLAVLPDCGPVDADNGAPCVIAVIAEAKKSGAGDAARIQAAYRTRVVDVDIILEAAHVAVVYIKGALVGGARNDCAIIEIYRYIMLAGTVIRVYIDDLARSIECAAIKGHHRGAVSPERIISAGAVKGRVGKYGALIPPVEGLAVDSAVIDDRIVCAYESEIIDCAGAERHIPESDGPGAVEAVVSVILCAVMCRVRNLRAYVPCGFITALSYESKIFTFRRTGAGNTVQRIVALSEGYRVTALSSGNSVQ